VTLVIIGGMTNNHSIAYSLSNISSKNYQHEFRSIEVIMCYISIVSVESQRIT